jgi:hypothetical protein
MWGIMSLAAARFVTAETEEGAMRSHHRNGETRTCPYCGQRSTFSERLRKPETGVKPIETRGSAPDPEYRPGWDCENKHCPRRYDFS